MTTVSARASSFPAFEQCGRRWAAITLRDRLAQWDIGESRPHIGAAVGTAFHLGAAHLMRELARTGEAGGTARLGEARELAMLSITQAPVTTWDQVTPHRGAAETQLGRMIGAYHLTIDPALPPLLVESGLKMRIGEGFEVTGHVDLFLTDGVLEDHKTGRHRPSAYSQYGTYSLLARANGYRVAGWFRERYLPRAPVNKPQPTPIISTFDQGAIERHALGTARQIERAVQRFDETGDRASFLANPSTWLCQQHLCPAFGSKWCDAWRMKT